MENRLFIQVFIFFQGAKTEIEHEVIVVDDHGPEKVSSRFSKSNGIRLYKTPKNLGFTGACNHGAKYAKGEFLCFLNSDALVTDNWSDNLLNAYKLADNVGIVGPRLIHSNGKLQESGGIVLIMETQQILAEMLIYQIAGSNILKMLIMFGCSTCNTNKRF